jgi:excisionase family DNA binding protein
VADNGRGIPAGRRALRGEAMTGVCRAARDLGLSERTVRAAIRAGELPVYVFSRQARLRIVDVRNWLERHRVKP